MNRASQWSSIKSFFLRTSQPQDRAIDTANTISDNPCAVVISRRDPTSQQTNFLSAQTMRLDVVQSIRSASEQRDGWTDISRQYVVGLGYKNHPYIPNTDVKRADQFFYQGRMWEVVETIDNAPGRLLFSAEVTP